MLATIVVAAALVSWFVWRQYENARHDAERQLRSRAVLAATVFDTYFTGQLNALAAIASSPSVTSGDVPAMTRYFAAFRAGRKGNPFPAGVGWIDLSGHQRATSEPSGPTGLSLADRSYFREVVRTGKSFVSEAIVGRTSDRRLLVMSVPTRDARGRLAGVLASGLVLQESNGDSRASELGYEGLEVLDRKGQQVTRRDLARPENQALAAKLKNGEGVVVGTDGLTGAGGHVVAYATSKVPEWTTVLDQPESTVFASARRTLWIEVSLVAAATAVLLALLIWALRRSRRELRAGQARVSRWAGLTRDLNQAGDSHEVAALVARSLAREYPEAVTLVAVRRPGEQRPTFEAVHEGARSRVSGLTDHDARKVAASLETPVQALACETAAEVPSEIRSAVPEALVRSLYAMPLLDGAASSVGFAALLFASEHAVAAPDRALLQAHADQAGLALGRIGRHQQEHDVAVLLQESLLPAELSGGEGVLVAASYRAGVEYTAVGGDWYGAVRRPDARTHLTVGDVAGKGIEAAVSMGQLRNAFRAYALDHASPAEVIERMGRHVGDGEMATMVCVTYDPLTGELAYASAGHPPPLLLDKARDAVVRLDGAGTPPLGWSTTRAADALQAAVVTGSVLALYTDGLVERRGSPLDDDIDRLAHVLSEAVETSQSDVVRTVVDRMLESAAEDDVALMLATFEVAPRIVNVDIPAEPLEIRALRRRVRRWLEVRGMEKSACEAIVLGINEACNNAYEHGYRERGGRIRIRLEHGEAKVTARVSDDGTWREPIMDPTRGRGLMLMTGLADKADVKGGSNGTEVVLEKDLAESV